ncbi:MAG: hypothetical protein NZ480_05245, partial [Bdellovibrionaceae bacterium]|nr:hypothetical protein [Pseudobdellovibrionaceae bacterium]
MVIISLLLPLFLGFLLIGLRELDVKWHKWISVLGAISHLICSVLIFYHVESQGVVVTHLGGWLAPFGISFAVDHLNALMILVTSVIYVSGVVYSWSEVPHEGSYRHFYPLVHFLILGVSGAFLTGDYFNMYVWYEVMILSSFGLLVFTPLREQFDGILKYAILNFIASSLFLAGLGILYGTLGSLNIADVTQKIWQGVVGSESIWAASFFMAFGFLMKAGVFPLYQWLPSSYHLPLFSVSALFAGLLTKVGLYSAIRLFSLTLAPYGQTLGPVLLVVALLTMGFGVLGAVGSFHIRKILGFHIVSQIGYMLLAVSFYSEWALAAAIFYICHHILVKSNLYLIGGVVQATQGTEDLKETGYGWVTTPFLGICFIIAGFSLGGIPPLSGFWAKYLVFKEGLHLKHYGAVIVGVLVSLLTLFSMVKIWQEAFWKKFSQPR